MFGWFRSKPTCPVPPPARAWFESRTRWLVSEFGLAAARNAVTILPTPELQMLPQSEPASHLRQRGLTHQLCLQLRESSL